MPRGKGRGRGRGRKTTTRAKNVVKPRKPRWYAPSDDEELPEEDDLHTGVLTRNRSKRKFQEIYKDVLEEPESEDDLSSLGITSPAEEEEDEELNFDSIPPSPARTPIPLPDDESLPELLLPESCTDLLLEIDDVPSCLEVYEILWKFKTILRCSPFRLEDFCMALNVSENSMLLSEVHITLFKAIMREEDSTNTTFGPQDAKDSINICFFFNDSITWCETVRSYLNSRNDVPSEAVEILGKQHYSLTTVKERLVVLKSLVDIFLATNAVRNEISKAPEDIRHEEHCRLCYKGGDLICCDRCPAVYHLDCADPPLTQVPQDEWLCGICRASLTTGVTDCLSVEHLRHEPLGFDRHGRRYWFLSRRLLIESDKNICYFSSIQGVKEVLEKLDGDNYEKRLKAEILKRESLLKDHMNITKILTDKYRIPKGCQTVVDSESKLFNSMTEERTECVNGIKTETDENEAESDFQTKDNPTENIPNGEDSEIQDEEKSDTVVKEEQERDVKEEVKDEPMNTVEETSEPSGEEIEDMMEPNERRGIVTRSKTGSLTPRVFTDSVTGTRAPRQQRQYEMPPLPTRPAGSLYKLGMEGNYRNYVNHMNASELGLTKQQNQEERDRRRHLSHKFSLTTVSHFSWNGITFGSCESIVRTLRASVEQLENAIPPTFMHYNWSSHRHNWLRAINMCMSPKDFSLALAILEACIKPVVLNPIWNENVGHFRLQRQTQAARDEKKKKKKDDEEYVTKTAWIKNSKGFRHQVWKQKGEEYRLYWGCFGWLWVSIARKQRIINMNTVGLRSIAKKTDILDNEANNDKEKMDTNDNEKKCETEPLTSTEANEDEKKELTQQDGVIDVSKGLADRTWYPKLCDKTAKLDGLLERRSRQVVNTIKHRRSLQIALNAYKKAQEGGNLKKRGISTTCYSPSCDQNCYSPTCVGQQLKVSEGKVDKNDMVAYVTTPSGNTIAVDSKLAAALESKIEQYKFDTKEKVKQLPGTALKKKRRGHLPVVQKFCLRGKRSILLSDKLELRRLARNITKQLPGFHYGSKSVPEWIYPCPRPLFSTCWRYRMTLSTCLSACALQLRILWACIRWDDLDYKPTTPPGPHTVSTDTEIITTELLQKRHRGVYGLHTQYLQRKIIVPIGGGGGHRDEYTPIRSGLRERRRAASPKQKDPSVTEDWIDEDQLELWQIKQFSEHRVTTRSKANILEKLNEDKKKMESPKLPVRPSLTGVHRPLAPRTLVVQSPSVSAKNVVRVPTSTFKKPIQSSTSGSSGVSIIKDPSGRIQVRGLQPHQQIVQTPDGRFVVQTRRPQVVIQSSQQQNQQQQQQQPQQHQQIVVQQQAQPGQERQVVIRTPSGQLMRAQLAVRSPQQQTQPQIAIKPQVIQQGQSQQQQQRPVLVNVQQQSNNPVRLIPISSGGVVRAQLVQKTSPQVIIRQAVPQQVIVRQQAPVQTVQLQPSPVKTTASQAVLSTEANSPGVTNLVTTNPSQNIQDAKQSTAISTSASSVSATNTSQSQDQGKYKIPPEMLQQIVRTAMEQTSDPDRQAKLAAMQRNLESDQSSKELEVDPTYSPSNPLSDRQRRLLSSSATNSSTVTCSPSSYPPMRKRPLPLEMDPMRAKRIPKRTNRLFCVCKTPYDESKFYIGCDMCSNWFHGSCVGIEEDTAKAIESYVCDECKVHQNKTESELYCLCRKPYDPSQFYIGCDRCQDWFHGDCVGISKGEADDLATYVCPRCTTDTNSNKQLSDADYRELENLLKQLKAHRYAWPFQKPVDIKDAPDYYQVIKDPIDFKTIQERATRREYATLDQFTNDIMRVFHNCRLYNDSNTNYYKCADGLEKFFVQKIKGLQKQIS